MKRMLSLIVLLVVLSACDLAQPSPSPSPTKPIEVSPTTSGSPTPAEIVKPATAAPAPAQKTITPLALLATETVQSSSDRLTAKYWREWPVVPPLSAKAISILRAAIDNPLIELDTFSRVGDCQLTTETFLMGYATGVYVTPDELKPTVAYFQESIVTNSITAANGLGINSVLNPMFAAGAGHRECGPNETPLDCELRIRRPALVVLAMGTNWKPHGEVSFEKYLREVVDRILQTGALPILATKADNVEQDWKLNQVIAQVAYDYDLPLVNTWRTVQNFPNHGLEAPENIYLTGNGWLARNEAAADVGGSAVIVGSKRRWRVIGFLHFWQAPFTKTDIVKNEEWAYSMGMCGECYSA